MNVLFLAPWYPSSQDLMAGLFVQKHEEAVRAQGVDVRVIHSMEWMDTWRQWRELRRSGWKPDIVQVNVIQKQGLLALWLKKRYGIPYIIVEHWSGYLPENGQFLQMSAIKQRLYKRIAEQAEIVLSVSERHAKAMQECGIRNAHWGKINNVVDDFFFDNQKSRIENRGSKTFLHVSCFDERAKNVKGLLRAAKSLSEKRSDWKLVMVGDGADYQAVRAYAESLHFPKDVLQWTGEVTPRKVAEQMRQADCFVLSSNYENAPVVISESLAVGLPVIATRVGGIPEMVTKDCGLLVTPGNTSELEQAMETMLDYSQDYNRDLIRQSGEQYAFATVGKQLTNIYRQCTTR